MSDPTYIACPRCGEPYAMSPAQKRLFHGRTLACQRCAKPFTVTEETPEPVPAGLVRPWHQAAFPVSAPSDTPTANGAAPATGPRPAGSAPRPNQGMTAGRMALLVFGLLAVVSTVLWFALAPSVHRAREVGRRASCASNLQQIGMALLTYANTAKGQFPDSLGVLVRDGTVTPGMLVCPSSRDTPAPGATAAEQYANLSKVGHQSYVYIGRGLTVTSPRQPLAYEPMSHHAGDGINVLYTDGTVQFLPPAAAQTAIPQLAPPAKTTQPGTAPTGASGGP